MLTASNAEVVGTMTRGTASSVFGGNEPDAGTCVVASQKIVLNVSALPRMAVVPTDIEFAVQTRSQRMNTDVHSFAMASMPLLQ